MSNLDEFQELTQVEELQRTVQTLHRQLVKAKQRTDALVAAVHQAAKDAALVHGPSLPVPKPVADRRRRRSEAALLLLSDWHFGKRTSSFSLDVAQQRVRLLAQKAAKITEIERADHPVPEAHALLNGDLVDNLTIFPGHVHEVDSTLFQQVFAAAGSIEHLLTVLLAAIPTVHVWEQAGNHGRIGKRGDMPRADNVDLLVYRIVRERLSAYEAAGRLVWHAATSWYTLVRIGAYSALQIHGDQIKSFGGNVPAYGIARKCNAWASGVLGVQFSDVMMGHFHQPLVVPLANGRGRAFVNPSIESDSAYAQEFVAATGTPGQRLFYVDPEKGRITSERVLWLDE